MVQEAPSSVSHGPRALCPVVAQTAESGTSSASLDPHQARGCRGARPRPGHHPTVSRALPVLI